MYIVQYARRTSCFSLGLGLAVSIFQFWIVYHTVAQERDRGSRCDFVGSGYFQFWNAYRTVHKKDFVFLAMVRVSSQYFPVLDFMYVCMYVCINFIFRR